MCGIVGTIGIQSAGEVKRVIAARDSMVHRGPDDAGLWVREEAALGFRRLSILDLSPAGHQPMVDEEAGVGIVFNGEIYNFRELRALLALTRPFRSHSDTEVLLNGYLAWGWQKLLDSIDGMFAFAVWDSRKRILYAARDRAGKKPLFYCQAGGRFLFSSTPQGVLEMLGRTPQVDPAGLDAYLTFQAVPVPMTLFAGVSQLEPGHFLTFQAAKAKLAVRRYWDIKYVPKTTASEADVLDEAESLIRKAVRKRLMSEVPLGAFLSGGVDSSVVVAMMAQETSRPVEAIVIGFADPKFDERPFARKVAERWNVNLHEHVLPSSGLECLPEIVWQYGQPNADVSIVPTYHVAKAAKQFVTVVLNGDGGDELFGGYARPVLARAAEPYRRIVPAAVRRALHRWAPANRQGALRKIKLFTGAGAETAETAFRYDRGFGDVRAEFYHPGLLQRAGQLHPNGLYEQVWRAGEASDDVDRVLRLDFKTYLPDQLLNKMDVSTMAHSVEARSPLLDTALTEFTATLPTSLRLKGNVTKYLLKRIAARHVDKDVIYRRKRGFVIPVAQWMRAELLPVVSCVLGGREFREREIMRPEAVDQMLGEHLNFKRDWSQQLWTLLILEIWMRLFIDKTLDRSEPLDSLISRRSSAAAGSA